VEHAEEALELAHNTNSEEFLIPARKNTIFDGTSSLGGTTNLTALRKK
jgi:hypothetical protein